MTVLLTYLVHSTAVLSLVWAVDRFLLRDPSLRDTVWKVGLVVSVLSPLAAIVTWGGSEGERHQRREVAYSLRAGPGAVGESAREEITATVDVSCMRGAMSAFPASPGATLGAVDRCAVAGGARPPPLLLVLALVSGSLLARQLRQTYRLWHLLEKGTPFGPGPPFLPRRLRVLTLAGVPGPFAAGSNTVALPLRGVEEMSDPQLAAVVAHEAAHLERRDPLWQWAARLVESVCFFQPLNRLCRRRLEQVAELLCDDRARVLVGGGRDLAESIALVTTWNVQPKMAPGLAQTSGLASVRVSRLLGPKPGVVPPQIHLRAALWVLVIALATALPRISSPRPTAEVKIVLESAEGRPLSPRQELR